MSSALLDFEASKVVSNRLVGNHLITFEEFVDLHFEDENDVIYELVNGALEAHVAANLEHEYLYAWLLTTFRNLCSKYDLGVALGSRTPIKINTYGGRLPDILIVRKEREHIFGPKVLVESPDFVLEILSPADGRAHVSTLTAEYSLAQVPEIVFIDPRQKVVRVFRTGVDGYQEEVLSDGALRIDALSGALLPLEWIFAQKRPSEIDAAESMAASCAL
jgi:Uma2 family endonuclease